MAGVPTYLEVRASGVVDERDQLTGVRGYYTLLNGFDFKACKGKDVYVALCDIDNFRLINGAYGDNRGNEILTSIGKQIRECFGDECTFRYGSDEFLVARVFDTEEDFLARLHEMDERVLQVSLNDKALHITCSVGYAFGKIKSNSDLHEAVRIADRRMYEAKRLGKARSVGVTLEEGLATMQDHHAREGIYKTYEMDELTGLANLIHFRNAIERMLLHSDGRDEEDPLTLVYFNIENFKVYNERFGFAAGDELLLLVSDAIQDAFPHCLAARFSADQFMVATTRSRAVPGILVVRSAFRKRQKDSSIWLKAGINVTSAEDTDPGVACDRAKMACDAIKGRRDVFYREYDESLKRSILLKRYVLDHFDEALENGWVKIYYQPIIRVATGEVCDEEALARWIDPVEGIIAPVDFIPVLEEARLIHRLDLYIARRACANFSRIRDDGLSEVPISLNLSRLDFELCDIVQEIEDILDEFRIPRNMLTIEVTESALAGNQEFLKGEIDRFRADGFEVWMDDFGSGYSSLNLLKEYSFDLVKIDMGFLSDFDTNEQTRIMLAHIISMCKELGLKTLVEGVEDEEQLAFLKEIGCGRAQGFLLGKPASLRDAIEAEAAQEYPYIELSDTHDFYEAIGRVNLMRPDPTVPVGGHYVPGDTAAAVISCIDGRYEHLNVNAVYRAHLRRMGLESVAAANKSLNDASSASRACFDDAVKELSAVGDWTSCIYEDGGLKCWLRLKLVARDGSRNAVALLSIITDSQAA